MENSLKLIMLGVAVIIVAGIIGVAMTLNNTGSKTVTQGINQLNAELAGLTDTDKALYDGTVLSGSDVIQTIQKYNNDSNVYIIVSTLGTTGANNVLYDGSIVTAVASNDDAAAGFQTAKAAYIDTQIVSGWPTKYADGTPFTNKDESGKITPVFDTLTYPTCSPLSGTAGSLYAETSGYDSTKTSKDAGYIAPNASFDASIQRNQNNEVKFITFVQK